MSDDRFSLFDTSRNDQGERSDARVRSAISRMTLKLSDDDKPYQVHQVEGYPTELRSDVQRMGQHGFTSMPLPGAQALVTWSGGYRGFGTVIAVEDGRYRPKGLKPGEFALYLVTGADAKGEKGTMRQILKGSVEGGGTGQLLGVTIQVGDADTTNVNVSAKTKVTIKTPKAEISNGGTVKAVKLSDDSASKVLFAE